MKDPTAMGWPQSVALMGELELSKLVEQTRVHSGLLIAAALAVAVWVLMKYTVLGFDIRAVGANAFDQRYDPERGTTQRHRRRYPAIERFKYVCRWCSCRGRVGAMGACSP
jgi:hypothetical protein